MKLTEAAIRTFVLSLMLYGRPFLFDLSCFGMCVIANEQVRHILSPNVCLLKVANIYDHLA
jgi:hypothetical protein